MGNPSAPRGRGKTAVVLSGGGAKGAYEVGVLKALRAQGIEPDIWCGTSVGSFNAAMAAAGRPLAEIESVWLNLRTRDVFRPRVDPRDLLSMDLRAPIRLAYHSAVSVGSFLAETLRHGGRWWEALDLDDFLVDTSPFENLIRTNVDIHALHRSERVLCIALTRLKPAGASPLELVDGPSVTHRHIMASCSLPLIFPPVELAGGVFCDGGVVMNSPLKAAIDRGADEIFVVDLTPPPAEYLQGTLPLAYQVLSAQFGETLRRDIAYAHDLNRHFLAEFRKGRLSSGELEIERMEPGSEDVRTSRYRYLRIHVVRPASDLGGLEGFLKFEPENSRRFIEYGEQDGTRELDRIREQELVASDGSRMTLMYRQ